MTLEEIKKQIDYANGISDDPDAVLPIPPSEEMLSDWWNKLPRAPFNELPDRLKKKIREQFTTDRLREFLELLDAERTPVLKIIPVDLMWDTRKPDSMSFLDITEKIPKTKLDRILIKARNTAIYTIEPDRRIYLDTDTSTEDFTPVLYANHFMDALEAALLEYWAEEQKPSRITSTRKRNNPEQSEIALAGPYQYVISDPKYSKALSTLSNKNAYVALMDEDFFDKLKFVNGVLTYDQTIAGTIRQYSNNQYTDVQTLDFPLLIQIYTAAAKSTLRNDMYTITVDMPRFFREMGIEVASGKPNDMLKKLHSFEKCIGIMPGTKVIAKLLTIVEIKGNTMTLAIPYIFRLIDTLKAENLVERKDKKGQLISYTRPYHNRLVHSTIAKEKNKPATELVYAITNGLLQRGATPDSETYTRNMTEMDDQEKRTYTVKYRTLIQNCPTLKARLDAAKTTGNKNTHLQRAFTKAYELLDKRTDVSKYFIGLTYERIVPTTTSLDALLTISHYGKNGDYKPQS